MAMAPEPAVSGPSPPPGAAADVAMAASRTLVQALRVQLAAGGQAVDLIETHISWVLLAGEDVFKIKKPVRLAFLDFSSLAQRRHFCEEELRLNRRFAPALYREVLQITGTPTAPQIGGVGQPIECALRMQRFAPGALFSQRLAAGQLQPEQVDALAQRLAELHHSADAAPAGSPWGSDDLVLGQMQGVLAGLQAQGMDTTDWQQWLGQALPGLKSLWPQRQQAGRVRECHGDLHLNNAVVLHDAATGQDTVTGFDAIEFDPAMRWIDVCSDMAFMAMDLMAHGRADLAWRFINAWLDASGDHASVPLLRFYLVYRALVRALVGHLSAGPSHGPFADDYLALARDLALAVPTPRLLFTRGLSGSGKSTLAQRLLEQVGALRLRSDVERKRLFGLGALEASAARVPGGIYGAEATGRTYDRLIALSRGLLLAGYPVIVDAASLRCDERARGRALAHALGLPFTLLDCRADLAVLQQRVQARRARGDDPSEADLQVLARQLTFDEPLIAAEVGQAILVDTGRPVDVAALAARWLQALPV